MAIKRNYRGFGTYQIRGYRSPSTKDFTDPVKAKEVQELEAFFMVHVVPSERTIKQSVEEKKFNLK